MAHTLLDLAKLNGSRAVVGLIESVLDAAPEARVMPARTIRGTSFPTVIRHGLPTVGFRSANEGLAATKSKFETKNVECHIVDSAIQIDKAIADGHEDGAASLQAIEAEGVARASLIEVGKQVYYGQTNLGSAKAFPGLQQIVGSEMLVDATGTSANAATSVYAVKFGPQFVEMIYGNGTTLSLDPFQTQQVSDGNGGSYAAYTSNLTGWVGIKCVNPFAVGRICNLTAQNGKGLTDSLLADLLAKFPVGVMPDAIFMNRQSRSQLQKSRTVTLQGNGKAGSVGGAGGTIAPTPTEYDGIPIIATDSLLNTEAIVA